MVDNYLYLNGDKLQIHNRLKKNIRNINTKTKLLQTEMANLVSAQPSQIQQLELISKGAL